MKTEIVKEQEKGRPGNDAEKDGAPHNEDFVKELFSQPQDIIAENPQSGRTKAERPSESILPNSKDEEIFSDTRPSVREALKQIRQEQSEKSGSMQPTITDKAVEKILKAKER